MTTIDVRTPDDERAQVATALLADPADGRTVAEWGRNVGASGRTLARAFLAGTGMPFGQWRRLVRPLAPLPQLAVGQAVGRSPGTSAMRRPVPSSPPSAGKPASPPAACFRAGRPGP